MNDNKLKQSAHTIDTDELIKLLEEQEVIEDGPIDYEHDVLNFIATFNLEPGTERVKQHTLYLIYKAWSKNPLKKREFQAKMQDYFESTKTKSSFYLINQNSVKLTHSAYKYFTNRNIRLNSKTWAKHFENFLKFHSLTKGDTYIDYRILYFIYDKFCYATGLYKAPHSRLGEKSFKIYCKLYLPEKITKHGTLYGVSPNIEQFFQVGQLARMKDQYEKEANQKKRNPLRGFRSKAKPKNKV